jgi:hypothetical protein
VPYPELPIAADVDDQRATTSNATIYPPPDTAFVGGAGKIIVFAPRSWTGSAYRITNGLLRFDTSFFPADAYIVAAYLDTTKTNTFRDATDDLFQLWASTIAGHLLPVPRTTAARHLMPYPCPVKTLEEARGWLLAGGLAFGRRRGRL